MIGDLLGWEKVLGWSYNVLLYLAAKRLMSGRGHRILNARTKGDTQRRVLLSLLLFPFLLLLGCRYACWRRGGSYVVLLAVLLDVGLGNGTPLWLGLGLSWRGIGGLWPCFRWGGSGHRILLCARGMVRLGGFGRVWAALVACGSFYGRWALRSDSGYR